MAWMASRTMKIWYVSVSNSQIIGCHAFLLLLDDCTSYHSAELQNYMETESNSTAGRKFQKNTEKNVQFGSLFFAW